MNEKDEINNKHISVTLCVCEREREERMFADYPVFIYEISLPST